MCLWERVRTWTLLFSHYRIARTRTRTYEATSLQLHLPPKPQVGTSAVLGRKSQSNNLNERLRNFIAFALWTLHRLLTDRRTLQPQTTHLASSKPERSEQKPRSQQNGVRILAWRRERQCCEWERADTTRDHLPKKALDPSTWKSWVLRNEQRYQRQHQCEQPTDWPRDQSGRWQPSVNIFDSELELSFVVVVWRRLALRAKKSFWNLAVRVVALKLITA